MCSDRTVLITEQCALVWTYCAFICHDPIESGTYLCYLQIHRVNHKFNLLHRVMPI